MSNEPLLFDDMSPTAQHGNGPMLIPQGQRCFESHPDLKLGKGTLIGGNCHEHSKHKDVDLYVALDSYHRHPLFDPNHVSAALYYPIVNMAIPKRADKFTQLIDLICNALDKGGKVHVGCIGGHGRTGMVIAAVASRYGHQDPIKWVRENYCHKAVETTQQEGFLVANFGALPQPAKPKSVVDKRR